MASDSAGPAGPFVSMAVFCERLDWQPDGTVDVVGVVDGVSLSPDADPAGDAPDATAPVVRLLGLVSIRAARPAAVTPCRCGPTFPTASWARP